MPAPAIRGQIRAAAISLPAGLLLLIGGGAAVALGQRALGGALIALAVISVVIGWIILLRAKKATTSAVPASNDQRLSEIDDYLREATEGKDLP